MARTGANALKDGQAVPTSDNEMGSAVPIVPGQLRRRRFLSSEAIYRVLENDGLLVEVEVISAPGLTSGSRFRFAASAVAEMTVV
jgi:hypothetical protein